MKTLSAKLPAARPRRSAADDLPEVLEAPFAVKKVDTEMVGWIPTPHVEARTTQRGAVQRPEVKDEHVPWSAAAPGYSPRTTEFPLPWKTGEQGSDWTAALQKSFQPGGTCRLALLNPGGRTGLVGGWNANARKGANQAEDPIIMQDAAGEDHIIAFRGRAPGWPAAGTAWGRRDLPALPGDLANTLGAVGGSTQ